MVASVLAVAIGFPLYRFYRSRGWTSPLLYMLGGAAVPALIYAVPDLLPRMPGGFSFSTATCDVIVANVRTACGWLHFARGLSTTPCSGALAGLVFWGLLQWRPKAEQG